MYTLIKYLALCISFIFIYNSGQSQTTLGPNDVVILWCLAETTQSPSGPTANNDRVGLLLLKDITVGTQIKISDSGTNNCTSLEADEGEVTYTATMPLPAFTVIDFHIFQESNTGFGPDDNYAVPNGTMSYVGGMALSTGGDQVFVYQGDQVAGPTFIYSGFFDGTQWDSSCSSTGCVGSESVEPCSGGTFAFGAGEASEFDNSWYNGPIIFNSVQEAINSINDHTNWIGENGNTGAGENAATNMINNLVLPVELKKFEGKVQDEGNLLTWETSTEVNNSGFEIEFSADGRTFEKVGFVEGNENSTSEKSYTFLHRPYNETSSYYRLKQLDINGNFEYSHVILLARDLDNNISFYPNPVQDIVQISLESKSSKTTGFTVFNGVGAVVKEGTWELRNGENVNSLDLSELNDGVYFIKIDSNPHPYRITKI